jgi:hypothetical protein
MKIKKVEEIVYHNDYGLCRVLTDRVAVLFTNEIEISSEKKSKLYNLHNKPLVPASKFKLHDKIIDLECRKVGKVYYTSSVHNSVEYSIDDKSDYYLNNTIHQSIWLIELEDQQSGIDISYKTICEGHNVIKKQRYDHQIGVVTNHSFFLQELRCKDKEHVFLDRASSNAFSLEDACKHFNINMSDFSIGAIVTKKFQSNESLHGEIVSNEIKNMPGYVLLKLKANQNDPYKVAHILELKIK